MKNTKARRIKRLTRTIIRIPVPVTNESSVWEFKSVEFPVSSSMSGVLSIESVGAVVGGAVVGGGVEVVVVDVVVVVVEVVVEEVVGGVFFVVGVAFVVVVVVGLTKGPKCFWRFNFRPL